VFVGSVSGRFAAPFVGPYSASKHALEAIADSLRVELRPWKISVSLIEPGPIATPLWNRARDTAEELFAGMPPEAIERYGAVVPIMQRITEEEARNGLPPERVAEVVAHALSSSKPRTRYLIGPFESRVRARMGRLIPDRLRDALIVRATGLPE
jgi:NAD(P)-dependent dehydrogenase (short-subunit alcohol dehydrogenase family)